MREIRVLVTVQVDEADENDKHETDEMEYAAVEAVENAVKAAEARGFEHCRSDTLCVGFVDAVLYEEDE